MPNDQVGAVIIVQGLLPLRLNCPWLAAATTVMARSMKLGQTATIGAVQFIATCHCTLPSTVLMPSWPTTFAGSGGLYVALRISPFVRLWGLGRSPDKNQGF